MTNKRSLLLKRPVFFYLLLVCGASNSVSTHVAAEIAPTQQPDNTNRLSAPPLITDFYPKSGSAGDYIAIKGRNINGGIVKFNGAEAQSSSDIDPINPGLFATVPTNATTGFITLETTNGIATSLEPFTVTNRIYVPPVIRDFEPKSGPPGTSVILTGENLFSLFDVPIRIYISIRFNGVQAPDFTNIGSQDHLYGSVPTNATTGPITVQTLGGVFTTSENFVVTEPPRPSAPTVLGLGPAYGTVGTLVFIAGTGFIDMISVKFNGVESPFFDAGDFSAGALPGTGLYSRVPVGATTGPFTVVTTHGMATFSQDFIVLEEVESAPIETRPCPPLISGPAAVLSFTPRSGPPGTLVKVLGGDLTQATAVWVNDKRADFQIEGELIAEIPENANCGQILVSTPNGNFISRENFEVLTKDKLFISQSVSVSVMGLYYTILATNRGPSALTGAMLKSVIAPNTRVEYSNFWIGTNFVTNQLCTVTNGILSCDLGRLPVGEVATLQMAVGVFVPGTTKMVSSLQSEELDAAQANHTVVTYTFVEFGVNQDRILIKPYGRKQILVTWPQQTGAYLQATDSLSSPDWQGVGIPGGQNWTVIINDFQINGFYRLYSPGF